MWFTLPTLDHTELSGVWRSALALLAVALCASPSLMAAPAEATLRQAEQLYLNGRYAEAREIFAARPQAASERALYGEARCWQALGNREVAEQILIAALESDDSLPAVRTLLIELLTNRGEVGEAQQHIDLLHKAKQTSAMSQLLAAELAYGRGQLDKAEDFYRAAAAKAMAPQQALDLMALDQLLAAGKATAELASWEGATKPYRHLVQEFYPVIVARNPSYWPAHLEMARLFAAKFNTPASLVAMNKTLAANASTGEVYLLRAQLAIEEFNLPAAMKDIARALKLNDQSPEAHCLQADCFLAEFQFEAAFAALERAKKLDPLREATLGRIAGAMRGRDGAQENDNDSAWQQLRTQVLDRNPRCGRFYRAMGNTLDRMRKYPQAAEFYREATKVMPERMRVEAELGLLAMRLGREADAKQLLERAFAADPFHIRVKNSLEVLDVLNGYALLETEHFLLRFDRGQDQVMAEAAAEYLEEVVYPLLVERLGYEPPEKSLIEIFSHARNSSGHAWFSTRMVGLPFIGTVGACAGKMAAIVSPNDGRNFHWARVLRHEFVHVVNLQQTDFNIPHWYTEALAVWNEDRPRPAQWRVILAARHASDSLFDLDTINMGFIRPGNSANWALAYCQAELYAEYMVERFGQESLGEMLAKYRAHRTTEQAIDECFGVEQADFEAGYRTYVSKVVAKEQPASKEPQGASHWEEVVSDSPDEANPRAELALAYLRAGKLKQAKEAAAAALKLEGDHPLAAYVIGALLVKVDRGDSARKFLAARLNAESIEPHSLWLQAQLAAKASDWEQAEEAYRRGYDHLPHARNWLTGLQQVYEKSSNRAGQLWILEQLAEREEDDFELRKRLVSMATELGEVAIAGRWAEDACYINPQSPELWATAAKWHAAQGRWEKAARRWGWALHFDSKRNDWRLAMIEAMMQNQQIDQAAQALEPWAERAPNHADVLRLQKEIQRARTKQSE